MKQNDTRPAMFRSLSQTIDGASSVLSLAAASRVDLYFRPQNSAYVIAGTCAIASAVGGVVRHDWIAGETATTGVFNAEFQITWNDGGIETVPNDGYFSVEFVDDIGP